ncbi:MAG: hypothetical protein EAX89_01810 [Candidatus Lokiarchaeota archaeon]|nr:hypothetical protein [Candidatus Lokiarchaeota archaeon]
MQTFKIIPQFRDNCVIQGKKDWFQDLSLGDTIFLIANEPTKKFSIITKIDGIEPGEEPIIYVDQRNLEKFAEGDKVYLLKYNPAEAIEVRIHISDEYSLISKGDWTKNIKPSLTNRLIDIGQEISFLIPWDAGDPIIGAGLITSTLPNPPLFIGDRTKIILDKFSNEILSKLKRLTIQSKEDRVEILEKQIEQNIIEFIKKIKHQNYPFKGQKYQFKATNPKQLFESILTLFKGLDIIEEPVEKNFDEKDQDYFASVVFLNREIVPYLQLIDLQIIGLKNTGMLIIWVTGEKEEIVEETLNNYNTKISALKQGLEQHINLVSIQCPECGGALPIKDIQINGIVECAYCARISKIPKALRY